ncbi:MAG: nucleotide exchange factor GrpE [Deltaproteobacteria bacterium]|nr:nucleotide exchange factor GrpE [Deltaproteobacteria bacterium]
MRTVISFIVLFLFCVLPLAVQSADKDSENGAASGASPKGKKDSDADRRENEFKKLEAGTRILLSFPKTPKMLPFTESQLNRFRSSLSKSDQLGIVISDRRQQLLPMTEDAQVQVPTSKIIEGFNRAMQDSGDGTMGKEAATEDIDETIRNAVAQLSGMEGLLKAVVLIIDEPVDLVSPVDSTVSSASQQDSNVGSSDPDEAAATTALSTLLALHNIILYAVFPENINSKSLEMLTEQSGGGNIYLSSRVALNDALYMAYDAILLRTIQLAPQKALYEGDEICPPPPDEAAVAAGTSAPSESAAPNTYVITLLIVILGLMVVLLLLTVAVWQRGGGAPIEKSKEKTGEADTARDATSPAFSKLTIGINRVRNTFSDMESKLQALSGDLDDFGSENWEMQKKIVSAYAEISKELFLMLDHLTLEKMTLEKSNLDEGKTDAGALDKGALRSEDAAWIVRKIVQALENNGIEEIVPVVGERFHSKYHAHAGARASDSKAGTVLEVVRNGYQRKGFISDEPFVLRQAEVIVSSGQEEGK